MVERTFFKFNFSGKLLFKIKEIVQSLKPIQESHHGQNLDKDVLSTIRSTILCTSTSKKPTEIRKG